MKIVPPGKIRRAIIAVTEQKLCLRSVRITDESAKFLRVTAKN